MSLARETIYTLRLEDRLAAIMIPGGGKDKTARWRAAESKSRGHRGAAPDLVLATTSINRRETVDALARLGIAVYTSDPHTVQKRNAGFDEKIATLAGAGTTETRNRWSSANAARCFADAAGGPTFRRPMCYLSCGRAQLITIGQNTFIVPDALAWAGAESVIVSKQNWPTIGLEEVVRLQPEYIVFSNHTGSTAVEIKELRWSPGWKRLVVEPGTSCCCAMKLHCDPLPD